VIFNLRYLRLMIFSSDENFARQLDREDSAPRLPRKIFLCHSAKTTASHYFAGNSLGLMPKSARQIVADELDNWAKLGVECASRYWTPWYSYHEALREPTAARWRKLLEVICMNSLTVTFT